MDSTMRKTLLLLLMWSMPLAAQTPESGRDIAQKALAAQFSFKTLRVAGEMTLMRGGESSGQRSFSLELFEQEAATAIDKARVTITAPTALKDTQLLSWSSDGGDDQQ